MIAIFKRYGICGFIKLCIDLIKTRIYYYNARLIRWPFYIRGRSFIKIGDYFTTGVGVRLDAFPFDKRVVLRIGDNVQLNDYVHISAIYDVTIGNDVLIASRVFISDHNHGGFNTNEQVNSPIVPPVQRPLSFKAVYIADKVWLGEGVCILPGVMIGEGSVVGAGSVVTHNIPANCVLAGAPARIIRRYDFTTNEWRRT